MITINRISWLQSALAARKPVVAAIDGPAFGGGLEIALVCALMLLMQNVEMSLSYFLMVSWLFTLYWLIRLAMRVYQPLQHN